MYTTRNSCSPKCSRINWLASVHITLLTTEYLTVYNILVTHQTNVFIHRSIQLFQNSRMWFLRWLFKDRLKTGVRACMSVCSAVLSFYKISLAVKAFARISARKPSIRADVLEVFFSPSRKIPRYCLQTVPTNPFPVQYSRSYSHFTIRYITFADKSTNKTVHSVKAVFFL